MTDVGTTRRGSMSPSRRLRIWEAHKGICVVCRLPIDGTREKWIVEHVRPLELGGTDADDNCGPAHEACGVEKTRTDHRDAARAKRRKMKALGIKKPRTITRWRRFDGTAVYADRER